MSNKSFRLWKKDGEPINVDARRVEFTREPDGLAVSIFDGLGKPKRMKGILAMTEIQPPIIFERKK